jgi:hypothetical protein
MEQFEAVGFNVLTVEVSIPLGCDPGSLGDPYSKFHGTFKA